MNLGHIALIQKDTKETLKCYRQAWEVAQRTHSIKSLQNGFEEDWPLLERQGVSKETYRELIEKAKAGLEEA